MNWSKILRRAILPAIIAVAVFAYYLRDGDSAVGYVTAQVSRGPIVRSVIATGTVNPVTTVQVGSYVSGPIQAIYADFNAPVKAGQLIAKIDPRPFQVKVDQARAAVDNAKAQLRKDQADLGYKEITYKRNKSLFEADAVSEDTVDSAMSAYLQDKAQIALDRANIEQQQANLQDAEVSLGYTSIVSPVDGTVVSRNVDVGQTVAASFQTPTLFLIAKDLTKMQADTNVSESDIGDIQTGQAAEFKVDAFPDRVFEGVVGQVRQAPITVQNVVTYDVVVNVANPELLLKPGMTANVTIITAKRDNAVRIPEQALRFSPKGLSGGTVSFPDSESGGISRRARVWIENDGGLKAVMVTTGLDDGNNVELLSGDLQPGEAVVVDTVRAGSAGARGRTLHFPH
ncbi:MAG: efflux RND transporter periplasmic adaptor subunit [Candidatus Binataceae bacterium]